jgi:hypothetical protein
VDNIKAIIFIPEAVEDIANFESSISSGGQPKGRTYVRLCGGCGIGEWTRSRPITYLSGLDEGFRTLTSGNDCATSYALSISIHLVDRGEDGTYHLPVPHPTSRIYFWPMSSSAFK